MTDTTQLEDAELRALQDAVASPGGRKVDVQARNFSQPRRLSSERRLLLGKLIGASLAGLCNEIAAPLRSYHKLHLVSINEVNVVGLFDDVEAPLFIHCLRVKGHIAWVVWDSAAASSAVEAVVTGDQVAPESRRLSRSECRVVEDVLDRIALRVCKSLGISSEPGRVAQDPEELITLRDASPDADTRRLLVHLMFDGPGGPTDMRLYLPDLDDEAHDELTEPARLPDHLDDVHLPLSACLGSVDVPLSELLSLEIGDVLPLDTEIDAPLSIFVEDRACAKASWGLHRGNLAVRIDEVDLSNTEFHPSAE